MSCKKVQQTKITMAKLIFSSLKFLLAFIVIKITTYVGSDVLPNYESILVTVYIIQKSTTYIAKFVPFKDLKDIYQTHT